MSPLNHDPGRKSVRKVKAVTCGLPDAQSLRNHLLYRRIRMPEASILLFPAEPREKFQKKLRAAGYRTARHCNGALGGGGRLH